MKRLGFSAALLLALAFIAVMSAQPASPARRSAQSSAPATPRVAMVPGHPPSSSSSPAASPTQMFQEYCFECHGKESPKGDLSIERLLEQPSADSVGANWQDWEKIAEMLETGSMPPEEATLFPSDAERAAATTWIRTSLKAYEDEHAGDPGRVTVRRLTSAEYAYAIRDLTGIDIPVGVDASSDSVGGEGFANFGDVQFVQDASIERYLEAAKQVADHSMIGAGPLEFFADPGKTGLELFALHRLEQLYSSKGFRVVSGEGGRPFGLDRYGKALFVAWQYKHRAALGTPKATLATLAAAEGITSRFAEHIWSVVNKPNTGYPTRVTVDGWRALPAPTKDTAASIAKAREGCDALYKALTGGFARRGAASSSSDLSTINSASNASTGASASTHTTGCTDTRNGRRRTFASKLSLIPRVSKDTGIAALCLRGRG